eukprot:CAMPEP_0184503100 /NCGR_PEP_ID=MMETSP0113_2-20130426/51687_1 /TAXON_ID=91329 /ORGANISM="Norrisiella sphaerica, Strain BC52" /LENGTH=793 /DNA_ID=CAMNT_0026892525 /DNA_START=554 /DNA_END=2936 /DNA_ORIENTATION=+
MASYLSYPGRDSSETPKSLLLTKERRAKRVQTYIRQLLDIDCMRPVTIEFLEIKDEVALAFTRRKAQRESLVDWQIRALCKARLDRKVQQTKLRVLEPGSIFVTEVLAEEDPTSRRGNTTKAHHMALETKQKFMEMHQEKIPEILAEAEKDRRRRSSAPPTPIPAKSSTYSNNLNSEKKLIMHAKSSSQLTARHMDLKHQRAAKFKMKYSKSQNISDLYRDKASNEAKQKFDVDPSIPRIGDKVLIHGLRAGARFNGKIARVMFDIVEGRFPVSIIKTGEKLRVRPENIRKILKENMRDTESHVNEFDISSNERPLVKDNSYPVESKQMIAPRKHISSNTVPSLPELPSAEVSVSLIDPKPNMLDASSNERPLVKNISLTAESKQMITPRKNISSHTVLSTPELPSAAVTTPTDPKADMLDNSCSFESKQIVAPGKHISSDTVLSIPKSPSAEVMVTPTNSKSNLPETNTSSEDATNGVVSKLDCTRISSTPPGKLASSQRQKSSSFRKKGSVSNLRKSKSLTRAPGSSKRTSSKSPRKNPPPFASRVKISPPKGRRTASPSKSGGRHSKVSKSNKVSPKGKFIVSPTRKKLPPPIPQIRHKHSSKACKSPKSSSPRSPASTVKHKSPATKGTSPKSIAGETVQHRSSASSKLKGTLKKLKRPHKKASSTTAGSEIWRKRSKEVNSLNRSTRALLNSGHSSAIDSPTMPKEEDFDAKECSNEQKYKVGQAVLLFGLKNAKRLNGKEARIMHSIVNGRYPVQMVGSGQKHSIRPQNIKLLDGSAGVNEVIPLSH